MSTPGSPWLGAPFWCCCGGVDSSSGSSGSGSDELWIPVCGDLPTTCVVTLPRTNFTDDAANDFFDGLQITGRWSQWVYVPTPPDDTYASVFYQCGGDPARITVSVLASTGGLYGESTGWHITLYLPANAPTGLAYSSGVAAGAVAIEW